MIMLSPGIELPADEGGLTDYAPGSDSHTWASRRSSTTPRRAGMWTVVGTHMNCIGIGTKECPMGTDLLTCCSRRRSTSSCRGTTTSTPAPTSWPRPPAATCDSFVLGGYDAELRGRR